MLDHSESRNSFLNSWYFLKQEKESSEIFTLNFIKIFMTKIYSVGFPINMIDISMHLGLFEVMLTALNLTYMCEREGGRALCCLRYMLARLLLCLFWWWRSMFVKWVLAPQSGRRLYFLLPRSICLAQAAAAHKSQVVGFINLQIREPKTSKARNS